MNVMTQCQQWYCYKWWCECVQNQKLFVRRGGGNINLWMQWKYKYSPKMLRKQKYETKLRKTKQIFRI